MTYRHIVPTLACLLAMSGATATLSPLIAGTTWLWWSIGTAACITATGWLVGRVAPRNLVIVVAELLVLAACCLVQVGGFAALLDPLTALAELRDDTSAGLDLIREGLPPVPASPGLIVLLMLLVGLCTICLDILAHEMRSGLGASLALLAVYSAPMVALREPAPAWTFFVIAAGVVALLVSIGQAQPRATDAATRTPARPAALVAGAAAVMVALGVTAQFPEATDDRLRRSGGETTITIDNPMYDVRDNLTSRSDATVLTYTTDDADPAPIRLAVVDTYDGLTFAPTLRPVRPADRVQDGLPINETLVEQFGTRAETSITLDALAASTFLPVPDLPAQAQIEGAWLYDPETLNILGRDQKAAAPLSYTVTSYDITPTAEILDERAATTGSDQGPWLQLPENFPPALAEVAGGIVDPQASDYAQIMALQDWFRVAGGFTYDLEVADDTSQAGLVGFLETKRGYCVHFASSMALMARTLGHPARVVVGFLPGETEPDQSGADATWTVRGRDAHAWPEVYFTGVGWVRFEPTPAQHVGDPPEWARTPQQVEQPDDVQADPTPEPEEVPEPATPEPVSEESQVPEGGQAAAPAADAPGGVNVLAFWVLAGIGLAVVLVLAPRFAILGWRRARARRSTPSPDRVWGGLDADMRALSDPALPHETVTETTARWASRHELSAEAQQGLQRVCAAVNDHRYAARAESRVNVDQLKRDATRVAHEALAGQTRAARVWAWLAPGVAAPRWLSRR